jgi:hypothetical protein
MVRTTNSPSKDLENGADLRPTLQVTKIVAVEPLQINAPSFVEVVSPDGWVLRSPALLQSSQILDFVSAVRTGSTL